MNGSIVLKSSWISIELMRIYLQKTKNKKYIKSIFIWKEEKIGAVGTLNIEYWLEYVFTKLGFKDHYIFNFKILKNQKLFFGTYFLLTLHVFYINPHYKTNWNK